MPRYLVDTLGARKIGEMGQWVSTMCYPFQVAGTRDTFRPGAAYRDGLPDRALFRENEFYDAGEGLIVFLGEEPWSRIDIYGEAFFQAVRELGIKQTVAVEGYNGPAPPDLERSVNCVYSQPEMMETLERYGVRFSSSGRDNRRGPTIGAALVILAHYEHPDIEMFRLGAMAPMYPFTTSNKEQVGITTDHRSFYDIMRRLKALFRLDIDLAELKALGDTESDDLQEQLERIAAANPEAKRIIDQVRADYRFIPYVESVALDPALDQTLEDIS